MDRRAMSASRSPRRANSEMGSAEVAAGGRVSRRGFRYRRAMARPRSILGLLFHLVMLHLRRRPLWLATAGLALAVIAWPRGADRAPRGGLQLAVVQDGFLSTHPTDGGRRVIELDPQGRERGAAIVRHADDQRIVGTTAGATVAWQADRKVHLARVVDDRDEGTWGKSVRQLCDGIASNDARFAVGWLESDDSVWIVHGPVTASAAADAGAFDVASPSAELVRSDWCGVASADQNVALLWRAADKLKFAMCTKRRCSGLIASFKLDRRLPILGFGCLGNACLIATRDDAGNPRIALLTETSKMKWTRPLDATGATVSVLGIGDRAFAVGYATKAGAEIVRIDRTGAATPLWRDAAATGAPAVMWSSGRLLIAHHHGDALVHETLALAR